MNNYFNFKEFDNTILITNDFGRYQFLDKEEFKRFFFETIHEGEDLFLRLKNDLFIIDEPTDIFSQEEYLHLRESKKYLLTGPVLHIFVLTNRCNASCRYCQANTLDASNHGDMKIQIAKKAVDIALDSPEQRLTFEFQGGEPLLNFPVIKFIVEYSQENKGNKTIDYTIVSNLSVMTKDILEYLLRNKVSIGTSLDGNEWLHNANRPLKNGDNSFELVKKWIRVCCESGIEIGAIQTTSRESISQYKEIIDTYVELGIQNVFIRPLTPLGYAQARWEEIGYSPEEFIEFYGNCLQYILELNSKGVNVRESHAGIFLSKIIRGKGINYMELRSPCGASIGQLAYNYDGQIYTCDEGRMLAAMGDNSFCLGDVLNTKYDDLIENPVSKATCIASTLESIPSCCDCVYAPYCGVCPVINYALDGDIFSKQTNNYRCKVYKGMLDKIFAILMGKPPKEIEILKTWI